MLTPNEIKTIAKHPRLADAIMKASLPRGNYEKTEPSLARKAVNLGKAVVRHAATGFQEVSQEAQDRRISLCVTGCGLYDAEKDICTHADCGCPIKHSVIPGLRKVQMASSKCPIGRWDAEVVKPRQSDNGGMYRPGCGGCGQK